MIIVRDLDWQFGILNLAGDFNRNFFDWVRQICSEYSPLRRCQLPVVNKPVKSLGCVTIELAAQKIMITMRDLDWQFGISN